MESEVVYSYSTFCRRYREWEKTKSLVYRTEYEPGDRACSDYVGAKLSYWDNEGEEHEVENFVSTLAASNLIYAEATEDQSVLSWCGSHVRAFEYFGGSPRLLVIDNLKSGVARRCRYEPELNRMFSEFGEHYELAISLARVTRPRDKAKEEEAVQLVERWILAPIRKRRFLSLCQMNTSIKELLEEPNARPMRDYQCSRRELFERSEKALLRALPNLKGWGNYFSHAKQSKTEFQFLDKWIRRRLRSLVWNQWVTRRYRELRARGIPRILSWRAYKSSHGPWQIAKSPALHLAFLINSLTS